MPEAPFTIENDGPRITATTYWGTEHALKGLCYLSGNAGAWRLLVPRSAEGALPEMLTGRSVTLEPSVQEPGRCVDVVFEDGSDAPFFVAVDLRQKDRALTPGPCSVTVWTERGRALSLPGSVSPGLAEPG